MKSLLAESRARRFPRLCDRCRRTLGQRRNIRCSMGLDALRAPTKGMVEDSTPDPRAERIKARKERKARRSSLRTIARTDGIVAAAKFFLSGSPLPPASDECADCLALNRRAA